jgi:hypothetical protein
VLDIYFDMATLAQGTYKGGFFTDKNEDFLNKIQAATIHYFVMGNGSGSYPFNGVNYYTLAQYNPALQVTLSTVAETANFGSGSIPGRVMQFEVTPSMLPAPEPAAMAMMALGAAVLGLAGWKRKRI